MIRKNNLLVQLCLAALVTCGACGRSDGPATSQGDLIGAAEKGDIEAVRTMLDGSADVNAKRADGATALMLAAQNGHRDVAEMLVAKGA